MKETLEENLEWDIRQARRAISSAEEFYDVEIDEPEFDKTYGVPRYSSIDERVWLNPFMPFSGPHEARHHVQYEVAEEVVARNMEEVRDYYREELRDLQLYPMFHGFQWGVNEVRDRLNGINRLQDRHDHIIHEDDPSLISKSLLNLNYSTDESQMEYFASDGTVVNRGMHIVTGVVGVDAALNSSSELLHLAQEGLSSVGQVPDATSTLLVGTFCAGIGLTMAGKTYQGFRGQPLVDETVMDYDIPDRQRSVLYNSQVDSTVDEFLETLDDYGVT